MHNLLYLMNTPLRRRLLSSNVIQVSTKVNYFSNKNAKSARKKLSKINPVCRTMKDKYHLSASHSKTKSHGHNDEVKKMTTHKSYLDLALKKAQLELNSGFNMSRIQEQGKNVYEALIKKLSLKTLNGKGKAVLRAPKKIKEKLDRPKSAIPKLNESSTPSQNMPKNDNLNQVQVLDNNYRHEGEKKNKAVIPVTDRDPHRKRVMHRHKKSQEKPVMNITIRNVIKKTKPELEYHLKKLAEKYTTTTKSTYNVTYLKTTDTNKIKNKEKKHILRKKKEGVAQQILNFEKQKKIRMDLLKQVQSLSQQQKLKRNVSVKSVLQQNNAGLIGNQKIQPIRGNITNDFNKLDLMGKIAYKKCQTSNTQNKSNIINNQTYPSCAGETLIKQKQSQDWKSNWPSQSKSSENVLSSIELAADKKPMTFKDQYVSKTPDLNVKADKNTDELQVSFNKNVLDGTKACPNDFKTTEIPPNAKSDNVNPYISKKESKSSSHIKESAGTSSDFQSLPIKSKTTNPDPEIEKNSIQIVINKMESSLQECEHSKNKIQVMSNEYSLKLAEVKNRANEVIGANLKSTTCDVSDLTEIQSKVTTPKSEITQNSLQTIKYDKLIRERINKDVAAPHDPISRKNTKGEIVNMPKKVYVPDHYSNEVIQTRFNKCAMPIDLVASEIKHKNFNNELKPAEGAVKTDIGSKYKSQEVKQDYPAVGGIPRNNEKELMIKTLSSNGNDTTYCYKVIHIKRNLSASKNVGSSPPESKPIIPKSTPKITSTICTINEKRKSDKGNAIQANNNKIALSHIDLNLTDQEKLLINQSRIDKEPRRFSNIKESTKSIDIIQTRPFNPLSSSEMTSFPKYDSKVSKISENSKRIDTESSSVSQPKQSGKTFTAEPNALNRMLQKIKNLSENKDPLMSTSTKQEITSGLEVPEILNKIYSLPNVLIQSKNELKHVKKETETKICRRDLTCVEESQIRRARTCDIPKDAKKELKMKKEASKSTSQYADRKEDSQFNNLMLPGLYENIHVNSSYHKTEIATKPVKYEPKKDKISVNEKKNSDYKDNIQTKIDNTRFNPNFLKEAQKIENDRNQPNNKITMKNKEEIETRLNERISSGCVNKPEMTSKDSIYAPKIRESSKSNNSNAMLNKIESSSSLLISLDNKSKPIKNEFNELLKKNEKLMFNEIVQANLTKKNLSQVNGTVPENRPRNTKQESEAAKNFKRTAGEREWCTEHPQYINLRSENAKNPTEKSKDSSQSPLEIQSSNKSSKNIEINTNEEKKKCAAAPDKYNSATIEDKLKSSLTKPPVSIENSSSSSKISNSLDIVYPSPVGFIDNYATEVEEQTKSNETDSLIGSSNNEDKNTLNHNISTTEDSNNALNNFNSHKYFLKNYENILIQNMDTIKDYKNNTKSQKGNEELLQESKIAKFPPTDKASVLLLDNYATNDEFHFWQIIFNYSNLENISFKFNETLRNMLRKSFDRNKPLISSGNSLPVTEENYKPETSLSNERDIIIPLEKKKKLGVKLLLGLALQNTSHSSFKNKEDNLIMFCLKLPDFSTNKCDLSQLSLLSEINNYFLTSQLKENLTNFHTNQDSPNSHEISLHEEDSPKLLIWDKLEEDNDQTIFHVNGTLTGISEKLRQLPEININEHPANSVVTGLDGTKCDKTEYIDITGDQCIDSIPIKLSDVGIMQSEINFPTKAGQQSETHKVPDNAVKQSEAYKSNLELFNSSLRRKNESTVEKMLQKHLEPLKNNQESYLDKNRYKKMNGLRKYKNNRKLKAKKSYKMNKSSRIDIKKISKLNRKTFDKPVETKIEYSTPKVEVSNHNHAKKVTTKSKYVNLPNKDGQKLSYLPNSNITEINSEKLKKNLKIPKNTTENSQINEMNGSSFKEIVELKGNCPDCENVIARNKLLNARKEMKEFELKVINMTKDGTTMQSQCMHYSTINKQRNSLCSRKNERCNENISKYIKKIRSDVGNKIQNDLPNIKPGTKIPPQKKISRIITINHCQNNTAKKLVQMLKHDKSALNNYEKIINKKSISFKDSILYFNKEKKKAFVKNILSKKNGMSFREVISYINGNAEVDRNKLSYFTDKDDIKEEIKSITFLSELKNTSFHEEKKINVSNLDKIKNLTLKTNPYHVLNQQLKSDKKKLISNFLKKQTNQIFKMPANLKDNDKNLENTNKTLQKKIIDPILLNKEINKEIQKCDFLTKISNKDLTTNSSLTKNTAMNLNQITEKDLNQESLRNKSNYLNTIIPTQKIKTNLVLSKSDESKVEIEKSRNIFKNLCKFTPEPGIKPNNQQSRKDELKLFYLKPDTKNMEKQDSQIRAENDIGNKALMAMKENLKKELSEATRVLLSNKNISKSKVKEKEPQNNAKNYDSKKKIVTMEDYSKLIKSQRGTQENGTNFTTDKMLLFMKDDLQTKSIEDTKQIMSNSDSIDNEKKQESEIHDTESNENKIPVNMKDDLNLIEDPRMLLSSEGVSVVNAKKQDPTNHGINGNENKSAVSMKDAPESKLIEAIKSCSKEIVIDILKEKEYQKGSTNVNAIKNPLLLPMEDNPKAKLIEDTRKLLSNKSDSNAHAKEQQSQNYATNSTENNTQVPVKGYSKSKLIEDTKMILSNNSARVANVIEHQSDAINDTDDKTILMNEDSKSKLIETKRKIILNKMVNNVLNEQGPQNRAISDTGNKTLLPTKIDSKTELIKDSRKLISNNSVAKANEKEQSQNYAKNDNENKTLTPMKVISKSKLIEAIKSLSNETVINILNDQVFGNSDGNVLKNKTHSSKIKDTKSKLIYDTKKLLSNESDIMSIEKERKSQKNGTKSPQNKTLVLIKDDLKSKLSQDMTSLLSNKGTSITNAKEQSQNHASNLSENKIIQMKEDPETKLIEATVEPLYHKCAKTNAKEQESQNTIGTNISNNSENIILSINDDSKVKFTEPTNKTLLCNENVMINEKGQGFQNSITNDAENKTVLSMRDESKSKLIEAIKKSLSDESVTLTKNINSSSTGKVFLDNKIDLDHKENNFIKDGFQHYYEKMSHKDSKNATKADQVKMKDPVPTLIKPEPFEFLNKESNLKINKKKEITQLENNKITKHVSSAQRPDYGLKIGFRAIGGEDKINHIVKINNSDYNQANNTPKKLNFKYSKDREIQAVVKMLQAYAKENAQQLNKVETNNPNLENKTKGLQADAVMEMQLVSFLSDNSIHNKKHKHESTHLEHPQKDSCNNVLNELSMESKLLEFQVQECIKSDSLNQNNSRNDSEQRKIHTIDIARTYLDKNKVNVMSPSDNQNQSRNKAKLDIMAKNIQQKETKKTNEAQSYKLNILENKKESRTNISKSKDIKNSNQDIEVPEKRKDERIFTPKPFSSMGDFYNVKESIKYKLHNDRNRIKTPEIINVRSNQTINYTVSFRKGRKTSHPQINKALNYRSKQECKTQNMISESLYKSHSQNPKASIHESSKESPSVKLYGMKFRERASEKKNMFKTSSKLKNNLNEEKAHKKPTILDLPNLQNDHNINYKIVKKQSSHLAKINKRSFPAINSTQSQINFESLKKAKPKVNKRLGNKKYSSKAHKNALIHNKNLIYKPEKSVSQMELAEKEKAILPSIGNLMVNNHFPNIVESSNKGTSNHQIINEVNNPEFNSTHTWSVGSQITYRIKQKVHNKKEVTGHKIIDALEDLKPQSVLNDGSKKPHLSYSEMLTDLARNVEIF